MDGSFKKGWGLIMQRYVMGFLFDINDSPPRVALIKKIEPHLFAGHWNGIGGKIESSESSLKAMIREFKEETGVLILDWKLSIILRPPEAIVFVYKAFNIRLSEVKTVEEEVVDTFYVDKLPYDIVPNLRWIIPVQLASIEGNIDVTISRIGEVNNILDYGNFI